MDDGSRSPADTYAIGQGRRAWANRRTLLIACASFLMGAVLFGALTWDYAHLGEGTLFRVRSDGVSPAAAATLPVTDRSGAIPMDAGIAAGFDRRVAEMEQRLSLLDVQADEAAGNATRAEGMLIAFATRRTLDRGSPLGYLADQLRVRFGQSKPNAVQAILDFDRDPVTLPDLTARLEDLSLSLEEAPEGEGVWPWLTREIGNLFVIRNEGTPSPLPHRRIERARQYLLTGDTARAIAEVRALPNAAAAADWIADAERYERVQAALEVIETAAVIEREGLRNGEGARLQVMRR